MSMTPAGRDDPRQAGNGKKSQELKLKMPDAVASGVYANTMLVHHSREEFVMDFCMVVGGAGTVVSRVVTSPPHMKRVLAALEENVRRYEAAHGPIKGTDTPPPMLLGFQPPPGGEN